MVTQKKVKYQEMLPQEIVQRRKKYPAAFIGLGGLEWHSEHLAVGNDALKAEKLCELAALESGGFLFPTLWYGEPRLSGLMETNHDDDGKIKEKMEFDSDKFTSDYWNISGEEQEQFYQKLLYHVLIQLSTLEMKAICILCGHYPIYEWALPVVKKFNTKFKGVKAYAGTEHHFASNSPDVGGDHAGKWETSYLMYLRPECVDMSVYLGRDNESLIGIMGSDPRYKATKKIGRKACDIIVKNMVVKSNELLKQAED